MGSPPCPPPPTVVYWQGKGGLLLKISDKLVKKILRVVSEMDAGTACSLSDKWDGYAAVGIDDICKKTGASKEELSRAVSFMVKSGLAEYTTLKSSLGPVTTGFVLTHEGLNWKEILRNERNEFLLKSVLVPIIVSVLTSAVISLCSYLWTMSGISTLSDKITPSTEPMTEEATLTDVS